MAGNVVSNVKKYYGGQVPVPGQGDSDGKVKVLVEMTTTMEIEGVQTDVDLLYDADDLTTPVTPQKLGQWTDENYLIVFKTKDADGKVRGFILYALETEHTSTDTLVNNATFVAFKGLEIDPGASAFVFTMVEDSSTLSRYLQDENGELTVKFNLSCAYEGAQSGYLSDLIGTDSSCMRFEIVYDDEDNAYLNLNTDNLDDELEDIEERLDVIEGILDELPSDEHGYFNSSLVKTPGDGTTTSLVIDNFRISQGRSVHGDNIEFVATHQEGGVDFGEVYLNPGTYILNVHYTLQWVGNPRGTFLPLVANVGEQPFDFSYEHEDILRSTRIVTRTTRGKFGLNFPFDADTPPMGIWVKYLEIAQIASYNHPAVTHDSTLAGSGQIGDPLGVTTDVFGKVKDIPTSISQFRNGDVIPVDGPNGPAKMEAEKLLELTAQNALKSISNLKEEPRSMTDGLVVVDSDKTLKKVYLDSVVSTNEPSKIGTKNGYYLSDNGVEIPNEEFDINDYSINGIEKIFISAKMGAAAYICFLSKEGSLVSAVQGAEVYTQELVVPSGAVLVRVPYKPSGSLVVVNTIAGIERKSDFSFTASSYFNKYFNPSETGSKTGYYLDWNGTEIANPDYNINDYVVKGISKIHVNAKMTYLVYLWFFDFNGKKISSVQGSATFNQDVTVPSEAFFVRVPYHITEAMSVSTVGAIDIDSLESTVSDIGKDTINPVLIGTKVGKYINIIGTESSLESYSINDYLVFGLEKIYIQANIGSAAYIFFYTKNGTPISGVPGNPNAAINFKQEVSVPSGAYFVRVSYTTALSYLCINPSNVESFEKNLFCSNLYGKKIGLIGDSIAAGGNASSGHGFIKICSDLLFTSVSNASVAGWKFCDNDNKGVYRQIANLADDISMLVIFAGTNDFGKNSPIGDVYAINASGRKEPTTSDYTTTMCGGINKAIETAYSKYGYIPIIICSIIQRGVSVYESVGGSWDKNALDKYLSDYNEAIKAVAEFWGIPLFDASAINMMPMVNGANSAYFADGLHPNDAGHKIIGTGLAKFIRKIFIDNSVASVQ